jgi:hypothetical protein
MTGNGTVDDLGRALADEHHAGKLSARLRIAKSLFIGPGL